MPFDWLRMSEREEISVVFRPEASLQDRDSPQNKPRPTVMETEFI